jgi:hypothetical protein
LRNEAVRQSCQTGAVTIETPKTPPHLKLPQDTGIVNFAAIRLPLLMDAPQAGMTIGLPPIGTAAPMDGSVDFFRHSLSFFLFRMVWSAVGN